MKWLNQAWSSLALLVLAGHTATALAAPNEGRHFVIFYAASGKALKQMSFPDARYCKALNVEVDKMADETGTELRSLGLVTACTEKSYADTLGAKAVMHDLVENILFELNAETVEECELAVVDGLAAVRPRDVLVVSACSLR